MSLFMSLFFLNVELFLTHCRLQQGNKINNPTNDLPYTHTHVFLTEIRKGWAVNTKRSETRYERKKTGKEVGAKRAVCQYGKGLERFNSIS